MHDTFERGCVKLRESTVLQDSLNSKSMGDFKSNPSNEITRQYGDARFDSRNKSNVNGNRTSPCAAKVLNDVSLLYIAFKRADVSNSGYATIEDIRKSFFEDSVVHNIFGLVVTQSKRKLSDDKALEDSPLIPLKLSPVSFNKKNKESHFKKASQSHKDILWECLTNNIVSSLSQYKNPFSNAFALDRWKNCMDTNLSFAKRKIAYLNDCFKQNIETRTEWAVESQKKLDIMLISLRRIEIDEIRCLSRRQNSCVTVRFPEYVSAFFIYISPTHPTVFKTGTFTQHILNAKPTKENMRLTLAEQFVRDGYLGTCITNYGGFFKRIDCYRDVNWYPLNCKFKYFLHKDADIRLNNNYASALKIVTLSFCYFEPLIESVFPRPLSLPKTFVMEGLIPGLAPDNKILFQDNPLSTTFSKGSRLSAIKKLNKGYLQNKIQRKTPLTNTKRENLTKELQILQSKIRTRQEHRIVRQGGAK